MLFFKKKKPENVMPVTIELYDDHFTVNGKEFTIPARVSELIELLGEPRCVADKNKDDPSFKDMICKNHGLPPERFAEMDYYWDELGLLASTYDRKTVNCFWIKIAEDRRYPMQMTKYDFSGTLLIRGRPWQEVADERSGNGTFYLGLGKLHAYVVRRGRKAKGVKQFQISLNMDEEFTFFD